MPLWEWKETQKMLRNKIRIMRNVALGTLLVLLFVVVPVLLGVLLSLLGVSAY